MKLSSIINDENYDLCLETEIYQEYLGKYSKTERDQ